LRGKVYRFKTKPWRHQVTALKKALRRPGFALFMEQRTGKSKVAIDWAGCLHLREGIDQLLIVCPYGVMGRWYLQLNWHMPKSIRKSLDIRIVHYKALYGRQYGEGRTWEVIDNEPLMRWALRDPRRLALVIDESTEISNPSSVIHKKLYKIAKHVKWKLLLTGTPFHKKPLGIFGQYKMINESVFGTRYEPFKRRFSIPIGFTGFQTKPYNLAQLARLISPYAYQVREEDCWDIPPIREEIVPVELEESAEIYDRMATDSIVQIQGHEVEAPLAITLALRLHQITGGHLRNPAGKTISVGNEKQRVYQSLLEQLQEEDRDKLVTFARFRPELALCARAALAVGYRPILLHGGVKSDRRDYRIAYFEESDEACIFISQIATGSMGLELSVASDTIFYSLTNSLLFYDQAKSRTRGHKQRASHITYWHLLADGTVDPAMYLALREHRSIGRMIMDHPEMLRSSFSK
jgi:hypothetical protein